MDKADSLRKLLNTACAEHYFSGYSFFAEREGRALSLQGGVTSYWPGGKRVEESTLFDIGSVTKAVCTGTLFALGLEKKEIRLTDSPDHFLPVKNTVYSQMTLGDLLTHCAGFVPFREVKADLLSYFMSEQKELVKSAPKEKTVYSDMDFILLGLIAEKIWGPLETAFSEKIAKPFGMKETLFCPEEKNNCAATSVDVESKHLTQGVVFDPRAQTLGGVAGHAGLFSTAKSLGAFAKQWVLAWQGQSALISSRVARLFASPSNFVPGSTYGFGWDTPSPSRSSAGTKLSRNAFGHLGYTGCSVWIDPERQATVVLLTNRVHPSVFDERIKQLRPLVHDEIADWFDQRA